MGKVKSLLMAQEEELKDLWHQLADLEMELAFLEHEQYSLDMRVRHKREQVADKQHEINNQIEDMQLTIRRSN